jgi:hypothetical protein
MFGALWAAPLAAPRLAGRIGFAPQLRSGVLIVYGLAFIAAAWWWRVPLAEQQALRQAAAMTEPDAAVIGCDELTSAADNFERASNGQMRLAKDGTILLKGALWSAMNADQREAFGVFASRLAECRGTSTGEPVIKDIDTKAELSSE